MNVGLPLRPCLSLEAWTCASVRPCVSDTEKYFRTSEVVWAKAFSMMRCGGVVVVDKNSVPLVLDYFGLVM